MISNFHWKTIAISAILATSMAKPVQAAYALAELDPEIVANSWEENNEKFGSVTLNGKEIIKLKESELNPNVEQKAEELAARLDELVSNDKFDAEKLFPAKDGKVGAMRVGGCTIIRFPALEPAEAGKPAPVSPLEQSWQVVNAIRNSFGATQIPQSFIKLSEVAMRGGAACSSKLFSGAASWYGGKFHGRKTSDGTRYDQDGLTAAHRSLPFGTKLLVMNRRTGDACVVKVNDRGPFVGNRIIDLSRGAARQLNMVSTGVAMVDCLVLEAQ